MTRITLRAFGRTLARTIALSLAAACAVPHARMVREAQDAFSAGAAIENEIKLGLRPPGIDDGNGLYAAAHGLIERVLAEAAADLRADDLYGTALTIRALCAWRLGDPDAAREAAAEVTALAADPEAGTRVWPRDRALCAALDPLTKIDALGVVARGFEAATTTAADTQAKLMRHVPGVQQGLRDAAASVPAGHPLRIYLAQAELELAYVVYRGLNKVDRGQRDPTQVDEYDRLRKSALGQLDELRRAFHEAGDRIDALQEHYRNLLLGVSRPVE